MIKHCVEKFQKKFEVYGGGKPPPRCNLRSRNFPLPPLKITLKILFKKSKMFQYFQIRHDFYFLIQFLQIEF